MKYVNVQHNGMQHLIPFSEIINKFNFLFLTEKGNCLEMIYEIRKEGNEAKVHFTDKNNIKRISGAVGNWESWKRWADVIVVDSESPALQVEKLKKEGCYSISYVSLKEKNFSEKISENIYNLFS